MKKKMFHVIIVSHISPDYQESKIVWAKNEAQAIKETEKEVNKGLIWPKYYVADCY